MPQIIRLHEKEKGGRGEEGCPHLVAGSEGNKADPKAIVLLASRRTIEDTASAIARKDQVGSGAAEDIEGP